MRVLLGLPIILVLTSVLSGVFSRLHDEWLLVQVRTWGLEIQNIKATTGKYPPTAAKNLHGYQARFINKENPNDPPIIYFHKFGQMRQTYQIADDLFLEEVES